MEAVRTGSALEHRHPPEEAAVHRAHHMEIMRILSAVHTGRMQILRGTAVQVPAEGLLILPEHILQRINGAAEEIPICSRLLSAAVHF